MCPTLLSIPTKKIYHNNKKGKNRKRRQKYWETAVCLDGTKCDPLADWRLVLGLKVWGQPGGIFPLASPGLSEVGSSFPEASWGRNHQPKTMDTWGSLKLVSTSNPRKANPLELFTNSRAIHFAQYSFHIRLAKVLAVNWLESSFCFLSFCF